jgi:hypothetical protein
MVETARLKDLITAKLAFQMLHILPQIADAMYLFLLRFLIQSFSTRERREFLLIIMNSSVVFSAGISIISLSAESRR